MELSAKLLIIFTLLFSIGLTEEKITYIDHVLPIFENKCLNCHNPDKAKGGLDLANYGAVMAGGSGGKVVEPGSPEASRLYTLMAHKEEPYMPPRKDKSPDEELQVIASWIKGGLLATTSSTAKKSEKPKLDMNLVVDGAGGKPEGPPAMPQHVHVQPAIVTKRPTTITAIAHSPWAPIVAVAGQKQVVLYHSEDFDVLGILPYPEGFPQSVSFSSSGTILQAGGGRGGKSGKVVAWNVNTGERVFEVGREFDIVLGSDISPDHRRVVMGGPNKIFKIWDTTKGEQTFAIKKHPDWMLSADYSPDGVLLATSGRNSELFIWEAESVLELYELKGHTKAVTDLAWRADSNILASISEDGDAMLWEMGDGSNIRRWQVHPEGGLGIDFSPDGSKLATVGRDKKLKIWKADGSMIHSIDASADIIVSVAFSQDNQRVFSGDYNGEIKVWDVETGKHIGGLQANPPTIEVQIEYAQNKISQLRSQVPILLKAKEESQNQLKQAIEQLAETTKQVNQFTPMKEALFGEVQKLDKRLASVKTEKNEADQLNAKSKQSLQKESKILSEIQGEHDKVRHELDSSKRSLVESEQVQKKARQAFETAKRLSGEEAEPARVAKQKAEYEKALAKYNQRRDQTGEFSKRFESLDKKLQSTRDAVAKIKQTIDQTSSVISKNTKVINEIAPKLQTAKTELEEISKKLDQLIQQNEKQTKSVESLKVKHSEFVHDAISAEEELKRNEFYERKYQAAAIHYQSKLENEVLQEMSQQLGVFEQNVESAKAEHSQASQARVAAETALAEAEHAVEVGTKKLTDTTVSVLERSVELVASRATVDLVEAATIEPEPDAEVEEVVLAVSQSLETESPEEIQAKVDQLLEHLGELNAKLTSSFDDADRTLDSVNKASDVAAKSPQIIKQRSEHEQQKAQILGEKQKIKSDHEQAIAKQKNFVSELKEKYLKAVPKRK